MNYYEKELNDTLIYIEEEEEQSMTNPPLSSSKTNEFHAQEPNI